ncbi:uncharacterized protein LOC123542175 isoform X3 [Mercenaria mercenaria]|uniref:uncharacterized protein LOC123542175 isoform X3 n=1 Tax=Mercenaria mercenaria TaxID=6596 RepID=UPI001E1DAA83|nr:uncharacterized protein LOC123542175 isoform X3 [Mercenaria mercenaria]
MKYRDERGRYRKFGEKKRRNEVSKRIIIEHNYTNTGLCNGSDCTATNCSNFHFELGASVSRDGWREGRRLIELDILLNNLKYCRSCKLGPVPLTAYNVVGELQKGLGGYLYVVCQNPDCNFVNRVAYGKVHRMKTNGMPCFDVNTKLGTAMIDSLGGPVRVNNFLSTLNVKPICNRNLKKMEERAGEAIENLKALIPHQFGDHSLCNERFCVFKRKPGEVYIHKSLPYKRSLKDDTLREKLQQIFDPLVANARQYADLGSSQQCEHANKEVSLRAPKSHHYGHSKSLDYRVHATASYINDGRHYIPELTAVRLLLHS